MKATATPTIKASARACLVALQHPGIRRRLAKKHGEKVEQELRRIAS